MTLDTAITTRQKKKGGYKDKSPEAQARRAARLKQLGENRTKLDLFLKNEPKSERQVPNLFRGLAGNNSPTMNALGYSDPVIQAFEASIVSRGLLHRADFDPRAEFERFVPRRGKGGKKRRSASPQISSAPKLLAPAPQAVDAKLRNNHKKRKVTGRHCGSKNVRTDLILELYDAARVGGRNDVGARAAAATKLPVNKRLDADDALKRNTRAVNHAVRMHRNNGVWEYPSVSDKSGNDKSGNKSDATLK